MSLDRSILIEGRKDINADFKNIIHFATKNVCTKTQKPITFYHHQNQSDFAEDLLKDANVCVDKIISIQELMQLENDVFSMDDYNKMLKKTEFWNSVGEDTSTVLLFQTDSGICGTKEELDLFTSYDYCGAPHRRSKILNGGFSLRNVGCMKRVIDEFPEEISKKQRGTDLDENEDHLFSRGAREVCSVCPNDVADRFATESIMNTSAWGFHANWKYKDSKFNMNRDIYACKINEDVAKLNEQLH